LVWVFFCRIVPGRVSPPPFENIIPTLLPPAASPPPQSLSTPAFCWIVFPKKGRRTSQTPGRTWMSLFFPGITFGHFWTLLQKILLADGYVRSGCLPTPPPPTFSFLSFTCFSLPSLFPPYYETSFFPPHPHHSSWLPNDLFPWFACFFASSLPPGSSLRRFFYYIPSDDHVFCVFFFRTPPGFFSPRCLSANLFLPGDCFPPHLLSLNWSLTTLWSFQVPTWLFFFSPLF